MHRLFALSNYKGCVNRENGEVLRTWCISGVSTNADRASDIVKSGIWLDCIFPYCRKQRLFAQLSKPVSKT